jgi:chromosome segregation ATPase
MSHPINIDCLRQELKDTNAKLEMTEAKLMQSEATVTSLKSTIQSLNLEKDKLLDDTAKMNHERDEIKDQLHDMETQLKQERKQFHKHKLEFQTVIAQHESKIQSLEEKINHNENVMIEERNDLVQKMEEEITRQKENMESMQQQLDAKTVAERKSREILAKLESEFSDLNIELMQLTDNIIEKNDQVENLSGSSRRSKGSIDSKSDFAKAQDRLSKIQKEYQSMKENLDKSTSKNMRLSEELEAALSKLEIYEKRAHEIEMENLKSNTADLQKISDEAFNQIDFLTKELDDTKYLLGIISNIFDTLS